MIAHISHRSAKPRLLLQHFGPEHPTMPGWFKGMQVILEERELWHPGLRRQCRGKCEVTATACCCRRILYLQPDFASQKSHLEELIESRGHVCDFYPKYHCELNFIEQYWGAAKLHYRTSKRTKSMAEMEQNMTQSLDSVPLLQIRRYVSYRLIHYIHTNNTTINSFANRSARFIDAYTKGLSGAQAAWATRRYHGHRVLPNSIFKELSDASM